jgi:hypothetical protein
VRPADVTDSTIVSLRGGFLDGWFGCRADGFESLANITRHQLSPFHEKVPVLHQGLSVGEGVMKAILGTSAAA